MKKSFTLVELLLIMTVVSFLAVSVFVFVNPDESRQRARDSKRLADLMVLDRAIVEYMIANKSYPDLPNVLRVSDTLPTGSLSLQSAESGWIKDDLSVFIPNMPTDPTNSSTYRYAYRHNGSSYELNARLEYLTEEPTLDGGNDDSVYELGNNLSLISP